jgi:hypothetical protein
VVEPGDFAVGGEEAGDDVLGGSSHGGHLRPDVQLVDVVGAVGLPEHDVDEAGELVELEAEVQVHQAVAFRPAVLVDPVVLVGDGHGVGGDGEHALELHHHGVDGVRARHGQGSAGGGHPARVLDGVHVDGLAVEGDLDVVLLLVPLGGLARPDVEAMLPEADPEGLHPREVALQLRVVVADEGQKILCGNTAPCRSCDTTGDTCPTGQKTSVRWWLHPLRLQADYRLSSLASKETDRAESSFQVSIGSGARRPRIANGGGGAPKSNR